MDVFGGHVVTDVGGGAHVAGTAGTVIAVPSGGHSVYLHGVGPFYFSVAPIGAAMGGTAYFAGTALYHVGIPGAGSIQLGAGADTLVQVGFLINKR